MVRIPASRTTVPALPAWFTPRPALRARLDAAAPGQLVAVIAPAGSGKTVLLAEWARSTDAAPTAWVGLDQDDADPDRFWSVVLAAVLATGVVPADSPLPALGRRSAEGTVPDVADALLDGLATLPTGLRLVLDDVHVLAGTQAGVRALDRLVRHRPPGLRLVLAARSDPAVGLPRLRLDDALCELRAADLRFTAGEAAALVTASGVTVSAQDVATLRRRTEGWAAGLRLAVLALRRDDGEAATAFLARFSGDDHSVADYLGEELLAGMDADDRELLGDLGVCGRLPDPLAIELSGHADVARRLEELAHGLGMIERVESAEHRVHALLRSHLAADLARRHPDRHRRQHAVAARWWAEHGEPGHALRHAREADDPALTADLLRRVAVPLLLHGELPALRRALGALGPGVLHDDPHLVLVAALVHLEAREHTAAAARRHRARALWPAAPAPALAALRTAVELLTGAAPVSETPVPDDPGLAGLLHHARGRSLLARGDAPAARGELQRALDAARNGGFPRLAANTLDDLALAALAEGDPAGVTGPATAACAADPTRPPAAAARSAALLAWADLLRGDPTRAADRCADALCADRLAPADAYALHAVHGSAVGDLGERGAGLAEARAARGALGDAVLEAPLAAALALLEHRDALRLGNLRAAGDAASWLAARTGEGDETRLVRAWTEAATGRWEAARTAIAPLHHRVRPPATLLVEAHLVDAESALRAGDTARGRTALDAALAAGRAHDVVRPCALAGPRTRALLLERPVTPDHAGRVVGTCAAVAGEAAPPLSERELVILALLPSLLDAPTMAEELVVSVNTVKTQIRSIYAKLGVSTRRGAVAQAQERGLLV